jgi:diguanylate cyclase (GGDEF)-like protein
VTNLANRALFGDRVGHALSRAKRRRSSTAVVFVDLDDFKRINDSAGHHVGDLVIAAVAERLEGCLRSGDTAARLGGDEFGILIEDLAGDEGVDEVATRILEAIAAPLPLTGEEVVVVTASAGIALSGPGELEPAERLRSADLAMYSAKAAGRNRFRRFEPAMHAAIVERVALEEQLRDAIRRNELVLHFQPVVDLASGRLTGAEALVRWQHPERGLLPPGAFIPLAEETGLIVPLGRTVLRMACQAGMGWQTSRRRLRLSVNLSARQVADPDLVDDVAAALRDSGLPPDCLTLEVTESVLVHDTIAIVERLRRLKDLGVRLAIDDFGTGYSALSYLRSFPFDELKIDRSFIATLDEGVREARIVGAIVELGLSLGLTTVAEGVEHAEQVEFLRLFGCTEIQGYLISKPLPPEAFVRFVDERPVVDELARSA